MLCLLFPPSVLRSRMLTLLSIPTDMSSSLLFAYPQIGVVPGAGLLGLFAYTFATVLPIFVFAFLGVYLRKRCPDGFTFTEFVRRRFGWPVGCLLSLIFVAFMLCFMITELNTYGSVVSLLGGVDPTIAAVVIALITFLYTAYGGFRASLYTDNVNAAVIIIFVIIAAGAIGGEVTITKERIDASGILTPTALGGQLWYILTIAIVFSQMFNQGFWQRAFAAKNNRALWGSVCIASVPLFAIVFFIGLCGPIAQWSGLFDGVTATDDGSSTFFYLLATLPTWVSGFIIVLAGLLSSSAYDTFQSAQITTIYNDVFLGRINIWWCRIALLCLNIPAVVLAVKNIDILQVFLIADLGAAAVLPAALLGLVPQFHFLNGLDVFIGSCGGFFTIFLFGLVYYHGDVHAAGDLLGLSQGLYISGSDYSVFGAFVAGPLGAIGWSFATCGARVGCTWLYCRIRGIPFVLQSQEWDIGEIAAIAPEEPRPTGFDGIHGSGNPGDDKKLEESDYASNEEAPGASRWQTFKAGLPTWRGFKAGAIEAAVPWRNP
jgi:Na+/proline symporter